MSIHTRPLGQQSRFWHMFSLSGRSVWNYGFWACIMSQIKLRWCQNPPKSCKRCLQTKTHSLCGKLSGKRWLLLRKTRSHMNAAAVLWFHIAVITKVFSVTCYNHLQHFLSKEEQETINSLFKMHSGDLYIVPLQSFWWIQGLTIVEIIISFNATQTPVKKQTLQEIAKILEPSCAVRRP